MENIGFYSYSFSVWTDYVSHSFGSSGTDDVIAAIIDSVEYNKFDLNISTVSEINDKRKRDFPLAIPVRYSLPLPDLLESIYASASVYRNDTNLVFSQNYAIQKVFQLAVIDLDTNIVEVGDLIKVQCMIKDSSIFNSRATYPEDGYLEFRIVDELTEVSDENLIKSFHLYQNYPNPFNPITTIKYYLDKATNVKLVVYNSIGKEIKELVSEYQTSGGYNYDFDGINLASGVYFYRLETDSKTEIKKMLLLK